MKTLKHVTHRPYPFDIVRKQRVEFALYQKGIRSIRTLANNINLNYKAVTAVVNGTRQSAKTEKKIADFLGADKDYLFPKRDKYTLQQQAIAQGLITEEEAVFRNEYKAFANLDEVSGF